MRATVAFHSIDLVQRVGIDHTVRASNKPYLGVQSAPLISRHIPAAVDISTERLRERVGAIHLRSNPDYPVASSDGSTGVHEDVVTRARDDSCLQIDSDGALTFEAVPVNVDGIAINR